MLLVKESVMANKIGIEFVLWSSLAAACAATFGAYYVIDHKDDETGTVLYKSNYEIFVDLNGDKIADRVIQFYDWKEETVGYYNYAQPGDKITYANTYRQNKLKGVGMFYNEIKKINGKSAKQIEEWHEMTRHASGR